jgi:hypothetical protein
MQKSVWSNRLHTLFTVGSPVLQSKAARKNVMLFLDKTVFSRFINRGKCRGLQIRTDLQEINIVRHIPPRFMPGAEKRTGYQAHVSGCTG